MKYLIIALALMMASCAAFTEKAQWSDADYGGIVNRIAYEAYNETHASTRAKDSLPHERKANKSCVDNTVLAAQKATAAGLAYEVVVFKSTEGLFHSAVKIGDEVVDIAFGETSPYADYLKKYGEPHGKYDVKPERIKSLFTAHNGTFK